MSSSLELFSYDSLLSSEVSGEVEVVRRRSCISSSRASAFHEKTIRAREDGRCLSLVATRCQSALLSQRLVSNRHVKPEQPAGVASAGAGALAMDKDLHAPL
jgi:hypothetical protein